jgi:hypothetical protein
MAEGNGSNGRHQHLLFVWTPTGYLLREVDGDAPEVGHRLQGDGRRLVVNKVGPSPLPGDRRPCAYTVGEDY